MNGKLVHLADHHPPRSNGGAVLRAQLEATQRLVDVAQKLSTARELADIMNVVKHAARELTHADGASFVLRDGDCCYYADEESITPLWKGGRFPMHICVSGWSMLHREGVVIEDIYKDMRVPADVYRSTYVTSLAMVPIRTADPVGAIGIYWSHHHRATEAEVTLLRALADLTSVAMENVRLYGELKAQVEETKRVMKSREEFITAAAHELRTPLTSLTLQVQSMEAMAEQQHQAIDPRWPGRLSAAVASAESLTNLVNDLLAATLSFKPASLNLSRFELVEVAKEAMEVVKIAANWAQTTFTLSFDEALWGRWDHERIEQALIAVLSNALKFGPGKPVHMTLREQGGFAQVEVRDGGNHFTASEQQDNSCVRRLDSAASHAGLGLGLFKAKQIAEAHGGSITVVNHASGGCSVTLSLPLNVS